MSPFQGYQRLHLLMGSFLFVLLVACILSLAGTVEGGGFGSDQSPQLFTLDMVVSTLDMTAYPTGNWLSTLTITGTLVVENYRPDDVSVSLNGTSNCGWVVTVDPPMFRFGPTRQEMRIFSADVYIPPNSFGPAISILDLTAVAKFPSKDVMDSEEVHIRIIDDVDAVMEGLSTFIQVNKEDRVFNGRVRLYNLMDVPQDFHICAIGDWSDRIPDLDFQGHTLLSPNERKEIAFLGHVSDDLEPGEYKLELALWTPGPDGEPTYILSRTVEMEIVALWEGDPLMLIKVGLSLLVITVTVTIVATVVFIRRRRREARNHKS